MGSNGSCGSCMEFFTQMSLVGKHELDVIKLACNFWLCYLWRILTTFGLSQCTPDSTQIWRSNLIRNCFSRKYDSIWQICSSCRVRCKASKGWTPGVFGVEFESTFGSRKDCLKHQKVQSNWPFGKLRYWFKHVQFYQFHLNLKVPLFILLPSRLWQYPFKCSPCVFKRVI